MMLCKDDPIIPKILFTRAFYKRSRYLWNINTKFLNVAMCELHLINIVMLDLTGK